MWHVRLSNVEIKKFNRNKRYMRVLDNSTTDDEIDVSVHDDSVFSNTSLGSTVNDI